MKEKDFKDRKIKNGVYVECIAEGCNKRPNGRGLCWEHQTIERQENSEEICDAYEEDKTNG